MSGSMLNFLTAVFPSLGSALRGALLRPESQSAEVQLRQSDLRDRTSSASQASTSRESSPERVSYSPSMLEEENVETQCQDRWPSRVTEDVDEEISYSPPPSSLRPRARLSSSGPRYRNVSAPDCNHNGLSLDERDPCAAVISSSYRPFAPASQPRRSLLSGSLTKSFDESEEDIARCIAECSSASTYNVFYTLMQRTTCYELIPTSAKLVVLDTQLNVEKAFYILVYNHMRAAPLWDTERQSFIGLLSINDFVNILVQHYHQSPGSSLLGLEDQTIHAWKTELSQEDGPVDPLLSVDPHAPLLDASRILCESRVHRLPVVDRKTGNFLCILTLKRILKCVYAIFKTQERIPKFWFMPLRQLDEIGSYDKIKSVSPGTPLIEALTLLSDGNVSALPIVNSDGRLVDIFSKFDTLILAADKSYNDLRVSVSELLSRRKRPFEDVLTCNLDDTFCDIVQKVVKYGVHRLVVVDGDKHVIGIVSLYDIISFLISKPYLTMTAPIHEAMSEEETEADVFDEDIAKRP